MAEGADLTLVRNRQVVVVVKNDDGSLANDSSGSHMILLIPALVPDDPAAWEKSFQVFLLETRQVRILKSAIFDSNLFPEGSSRRADSPFLLWRPST